jgi:predicted histidine transporter YuiF (NhaC family)
MALGQLVGFGIAVFMIAIGIILTLYSIYDRRKTAEEQAKKIAEEIAKSQSKKEGITSSPIPLAELDEIIAAIMKIQNPSMQVGVFLTVFGILVMIISIFIPF